MRMMLIFDSFWRFFSERQVWPLSSNELIEIFECDVLVTVIMIDDIIKLICKALGWGLTFYKEITPFLWFVAKIASAFLSILLISFASMIVSSISFLILYMFAFFFFLIGLSGFFLKIDLIKESAFEYLCSLFLSSLNQF